jgi:hypothetical protein
MARTFGSYGPAVPLGVTWEESLQLTDEDGTPIDISGYDVRSQFYVEKAPEADAVTHKALNDPVFELTTPDWYVVAPAWPVFEVWSIPTPTNGTLLFALDVASLWTASPDNTKRKLYWSIVLVNPDTLYAIPVVRGAVTLLPAGTL